MNKYNLTDEEANIIKEILKAIGRDDELNDSMAAALGMSQDKFNNVTDGIFIKLGMAV